MDNDIYINIDKRLLQYYWKLHDLIGQDFRAARSGEIAVRIRT